MESKDRVGGTTGRSGAPRTSLRKTNQRFSQLRLKKKITNRHEIDVDGSAVRGMVRRKGGVGIAANGTC